jgi:hypothetical protein
VPLPVIAVFRALSAAVALALAVLVFYAAGPNDPQWCTALPFALWVIGPAIAPCMIARRKSPRWFSMTMFSYFVVSSLFAGFAYHDAFFRSKSSTAALVMVFIPLYQWLALVILVLLCLGIRRVTRDT